MPPSQLPHLDAVRTAIDNLDRELVALLVQRQHLVANAAAFKKNRDEVAAPDRARSVVDRARRLAAESGGSADVIGQIFESMVTAFINHEHSQRDQLPPTPGVN
jgi:isochorismate pyruvate lyase